MGTFEDRARYWEASRRVRESFYRYTLADLLALVFDVTEIPGGSRPPVAQLADDEFEHVVRLLQDRIRAVEPAWEPAMDQQTPLPPDARDQVARAFAAVRESARAVAARQPPFGTLALTMTVKVAVSVPSESEPRARWTLRGSLADGIAWMGLKLLTEVDRSLIRPCAFEGCSRIYVAGKNQRYCIHHLVVARRQAQRRAERAFRTRQRAKKKRGKR
jgi:hypothetical protein